MRIIIVITFVFISVISFSQEKVSFVSLDGLSITADLYEINKSKPYVILFHQAGYSRGEYKETAKKIVKFGYNCLAVDLRSGGEVNYIQNHTALLALQQGYETDYLSSKQDIVASINWVKTRCKEPIVLFGSSFSASLCLIVANERDDVKAVVAFSPGEFFNSELSVKESITELNKPIFAASTQRELPYIKELLSLVPSRDKSIFAPSKSQGEHGSKSLWAANPSNREYWLALTMFFRKIR